MITVDPDYEILATRIVASNIQKRAANNFRDMLLFLYFSSFVDNVNGINDHIARVHFFWFALPH